ncbi:MAG TPA: DUF4446 family protein [Chloroflexota bacterium]|jgi:hypothetical protein|nr:DUF4446 family protein [Chloroflexota bacterium]
MAAAFQVYSVYLWATLVALVLVMGLWLITVQMRLNQLTEHYNRLIGDSNRETLEDSLNRFMDRLDDTTSQVDALDQVCRTVEQKVQSAIQRCGVIRFNPFADTGSDQSFAVALLDDAGNGIVFSSLFSRTSTRIFAKEVVGGKSPHALTDEEHEAIERAMSPEGRSIPQRAG